MPVSIHPGEGSDEMGVLTTVRQWLEQRVPLFDAVEGRWRSKAPEVRETALDLTHRQIDRQAQEIEETIARLRAEVDVVRSRRQGMENGGDRDGGVGDAAG